MPTDPVCGMHVTENSHLSSEVDGETYYFCSSNCKLQFSSPESEAKILKRRLTVSLSLSIPVILLTYILPQSFSLKELILLILATPVQFYAGYGFYSGAYMAIRERAGNMDLLIATGSSIAYFYSLFSVILAFQGILGQVFFDASSMIITLILVGNFIETRAKAGANRSANRLGTLLPSMVNRLDGDASEHVPLEEIKVGDTVIVKAGETVPVDGVIISGKAEIDNSIITGEQKPLLFEQGQSINSGAMDLNGVLHIKVTEVGKDSTILQIKSLIQKASASHIKVQRLADVFSAVFIKIVFASAFIAALFWFFFLYYSGSSQYLEICVLAFVSVVVVACPCAIGLATPITLLITANMASETGILFRDSGCLERLSKTDMVVFDKTGTITTDTPSVIGFQTTGVLNEIDTLSLLYSIEKNSRHPVAISISQYCMSNGAEERDIENVLETPGIGISGSFEGHNVKIVRNEVEDGSSVRMDMDDKTIATLFLVYELRPGISELINELNRMSIETALLTGDSKSEALRIGQKLGIKNIFGSLKPGDKSDKIHEMQKNGHYVLFIGDGINDTPALETADVSVVMGSGSDIARDSGDIILLNNNPESLLLIIEMGKQSIKKIRENIKWAIGYNGVLIPVAGGLLYPVLGLGMFTILPIFAALAMGLSSTTVVLNSLRLRHNKELVRHRPSGEPI